MDRKKYEKILAGKFIPYALIATRNTTPTRQTTAGWATDEHRDLTHNCWLIRTSDPEKKRGDESMVSFDSFVDFPRRSLAEDSFISDRLAKKLLVLSCLTLGPRDHGNLDSTYVAQLGMKFDWLLRYRLAENIGSFSGISTDFAHDFCALISPGGLLSLIPTDYRLDLLAQAASAGEWTLPMLAKGEINWLELAATLGTTRHSISRNIDFRLSLAEAFPTMNKHAMASLMRGLEGDDDVKEAEVSLEEVDEAAEGKEPNKKKMKAMALKGYMETIEFTYRVLSQSSSHDRMLVYPFEKQPIDALLDRYGLEHERTETILPSDMLRMMTEATRWVAVYGEYIAASLAEFKRAQRKGTRPRRSKALKLLKPPGAPTIRLAWTHPSCLPGEGEIMLDRAVKFLLASCAILVGSFAARRSIGVESLRYGCLSQENGLLKMALYIAKTDQDHVHIPVPELLRNVVDILEKLSSHLREKTGRKWLFEVAFNDENPGRLISISFNTTIKQFLDHCAVPPDGQERWSVAMHQLRRGYGIWFYYGMEGSNSDALSMMYRHRDPKMTRIYFTLALPGQINEIQNELEVRRKIAAANRTAEEQAWIVREELRLSYLRDHAESFDEVRCEIFLEKVIAVWRGHDSVIGHGGKALFADVNAMAERAMATIRIGSRVNNPSAIEAPLFDRFLNYVKTNFLEPVIGTNMWCRARPRHEEDLGRAHCLRSKKQSAAAWVSKDFVLRDLMPDYDFAGNEVCIGCPFCVAFEKGQKALRESLATEGMKAAKAPTVSLREEAELRLDELQEAILRAGPPLSGVRHEL